MAAAQAMVSIGAAIVQKAAHLGIGTELVYR